MNKFLTEVSQELAEKGVEENTINYVLAKLKQSFKTGAWAARQQAKESQAS